LPARNGLEGRRAHADLLRRASHASAAHVVGEAIGQSPPQIIVPVRRLHL
jgi:hypothetical protein